MSSGGGRCPDCRELRCVCPTPDLHGACLVPTKEPEARMNETDAAAYQPGPVFRTRMNKGRAQCEECGEWLDDCRCVDYVPERRRRESLSSRLAAMEAENERLRDALMRILGSGAGTREPGEGGCVGGRALMVL